MIASPKLWNHKDLDREAAALFTRELGLLAPTAQVLANRGVRSVAEAQAFLCPDLAGLHSPFLLPDIFPAVARIRRAIDAGEKILVYGDRDVDGVTALSVMIRMLRALGVDPLWYVPSDEGYGLHNPVIDRFAEQGVSLIITVDCGISAAGEIDHCTSLGIDVIVTDHHEPPVTGIPRAVAVIDPKRVDSAYPFKELAGCAVAFKLAEAVMQSFGRWYGRDMAFVFSDASGIVTALKDRNGIISETVAVQDEIVTPAAFRQWADTDVLVVMQNSATLATLEKMGGRPVKNQTITVPECSCTDVRQLRQQFYAHNRENDLRMQFFRDSQLDAVALGTIADMVPLSGENRILAWYGMGRIAHSAKAGMKVLIERCQEKTKNETIVTAKTISWTITPLLNAAGRRGKADLAAELLLTDDVYRAHDLMDALEQLNAERRKLQTKNLASFLPLVEEQCDLVNDKILVIAASGMEHGVTGIIASQIVRTYGRPVVLLIIDGDNAVGAARSIAGFDIVGAFNRVSDILVKFGGHTMAAGLTIAVEKIDELKSRLQTIARQEISDAQIVGSIDIDAVLKPAEISLALVQDLARLEPFGTGNPFPLFAVSAVRIREKTLLGATGTHLKMKISGTDGATVPAIGWNWGDRADDFPADTPMSMAVQLDINVWQDKRSVQLIILDVKEA
ncbi:MAG: single-stranded-DNA-specific exonuclease RecJ [Elusimicrobiota bacterium]